MIPPNVVSIASGGHRERVIRRRDELALAHLSLVDGLARKVHRSLPPSFDLCDLIGEGLLALCAAALRYRPDAHGGAPFSAFARKGIRGAMLESVRRKRYVENTRPGLEVLAETKTGREREFGSRFDFFDETAALDRAATAAVAEEALDAARLRRRIADAISWLPAAQRALLGHYYGPMEPTIGIVARSLGLSRAAALELHDEAIAAVRARLTGGAVERIAA